MLQSVDSWSPAHTAALEYTWGEYRVWAATAREQRAEIFSWRSRVLLLTIAGAVLGTLSNEIADPELEAAFWFSLPAILGLLSGATIALATFFAKEILRPD